MVQNGIFWTIEEQTYLVYYPIIYYRKIKVYRVETMDMGRYHWNNSVSGTDIISISTVVLIVQDKMLWYDYYYYLCSYMESYLDLLPQLWIHYCPHR